VTLPFAGLWRAILHLFLDVLLLLEDEHLVVGRRPVGSLCLPAFPAASTLEAPSYCFLVVLPFLHSSYYLCICRYTVGFGLLHLDGAYIL
jgi:hypothetical protein